MEHMQLDALSVDHETAVHLSRWFVENSQYFSCEPLPNDEYEFQYKREIRQAVKIELNVIKVSFPKVR